MGEDLVNVGQDAPVPAPGQDPDGTAPARGDGYAVALQWTALTPRPTFDAFDEMNTATDWTQFRAAAALLKEASQNLIYADVDGNIGYQAPGYIPIRRGYDGKWPVPGWTSEYGWDGAIPFEALPWAYNPPADWVGDGQPGGQRTPATPTSSPTTGRTAPAASGSSTESRPPPPGARG